MTAVFKSSVEVMVSVYGEHPFEEQHETFFVVDAFVTLVSVGLHGEPQMLAISLEPTTEAEVSRMEVLSCRQPAGAQISLPVRR